MGWFKPQHGRSSGRRKQTHFGCAARDHTPDRVDELQGRIEGGADGAFLRRRVFQHLVEMGEDILNSEVLPDPSGISPGQLDDPGLDLGPYDRYLVLNGGRLRVHGGSGGDWGDSHGLCGSRHAWTDKSIYKNGHGMYSAMPKKENLSRRNHGSTSYKGTDHRKDGLGPKGRIPKPMRGSHILVLFNEAVLVGLCSERRGLAAAGSYLSGGRQGPGL
ncbi:hypothetical protein P170DRAFT_251337 [Aspergillus steynii IBT 23096]|uniref:Uncharacterized protein n=1 Tax=Aspergillus steynii IBT 23096 TaxID=1392250 RepID=A0A2I2FYN3_9EURO|nr:uncharacterized protein P170DRAFT_251337 [Aspergillus steynii IBT 23096]PLB45750.1 hypothetical protein P170DRAFT_251337 [Aspergillus steynii IBT 23096]